MHFYHPTTKTVGGERKSTKKLPKMTSLSPLPAESKIGQPRNLCPEVTFSKIHLPYQFREDRMSGRCSKKADRRPDGRTSKSMISRHATHVRHEFFFSIFRVSSLYFPGGYK